MGADSSFATLAAVRSRLLADADLSSIVAGRIYTQAPQAVVFPWVQTGEVQALPFEDGGCIDGSEMFVTIHTWARSQTASAEVFAMNNAIRASLHGKTFPVVGHTMQLFECMSTRSMRDPDGITWHGIAEFHAYTTAD